jgi:hypothetical protein
MTVRIHKSGFKNNMYKLITHGLDSRCITLQGLSVKKANEVKACHFT